MNTATGARASSARTKICVPLVADINEAGTVRRDGQVAVVPADAQRGGTRGRDLQARDTRRRRLSLAHGDPHQRADDRAARDDRRDTDECDAPPLRHDRRRGRLRHSRLERALQRQPDVADGLHPLSGIFLQAASEVCAQRGRQRRRQPGPVRLTLDDARQRFRDTLARRTPAAP